jgi:hemoglobin-like flavoprotein
MHDDTTLVEASFNRVAPQAEALVKAFYDSLFARAPHLRPLFRGDQAEQRKKLISALVLAVGHLRKPAVLAPVLIGLGEKHANYGVEATHFEPVGAALLESLAAFDPQFDEATHAAWARVYGAIVGLMTQGLEKGRKAA